MVFAHVHPAWSLLLASTMVDGGEWKGEAAADEIRAIKARVEMIMLGT